MLRVVPLLMLAGCVSSSNPKPADTFFKDSERDWSEVYREEIRIAVANEDKEAYYFFMQELIKLRYAQSGLKVPASPRLEFRLVK